jgi:hypothetical protein
MASSVDSEQIVVLTKWGVRWLKHAWDVVVHGTPRVQFTKNLISKFDDVAEDPLEYVDGHVYTSVHHVYNKGVRTVVGEVERKKKVIRKGRRSYFASSVAKLAYNKFGERPMSEANILVTRKWLQKLLDEPEYKDLRTCDKNLAIDRALFLSFIPTNSFRQMKLAVATNAWKDRCDNETVFGKVFRLANWGSDPGSLDLVA